jgi:hypothetical protein
MNKTPKQMVSEAIAAMHGTSPNDTISHCTGLSTEAARKILTTSDGIKAACFACYVESTLQNTIEVLQAAGGMLLSNGDQKTVMDGIVTAEQALTGIVEELKTRHHGEGFPKNKVPVRGVPYVVTLPK